MSAVETSEPHVIPACKWTNGGEKVRIVKCVKPNLTSYGGFQWPESGQVKTETWGEDATCESGGLFGWPWGLAQGDGKDPDFQNDKWIVFEADPTDVIDLGGKCKAKEGNVIFAGSFIGAQLLVMAGRQKWIAQAARGSAASSGYSSSAASSGDSSSAASSGYRSSVRSTGARSIAAVTGEESLLESSSTGLACTTANRVRWLLRTGAVLCQRTEQGAFLLRSEDLGQDGDTVWIEHGKKIEVAPT